MKQQSSSSSHHLKEKVPNSSGVPNYFSAIINSPKKIVIFALDSNYCYTAFNDNHKETI